jgi:DNA-binding transcriptional ArsR family regulator
MRELTPEDLKALTHPIRVRMLRDLRSDGPATATLLARRLGESSGVTSYHLRQLERHGFVEDVPESGNGRERWWRAASGGHHVATERYLDDPESAAVVSMYESAVVDAYAQATKEWVLTQADWPVEWVEASALNDYRLHLTPARLRRLADAVDALVREQRDAPEEDGGEQVVVVFQAFPRRVRPFTEEA